VSVTRKWTLLRGGMSTRHTERPARETGPDHRHEGAATSIFDGSHDCLDTGNVTSHRAELDL